MVTTHITEKTCTKCKKTKPVDEFYKQARGYTTYCKTCMKELSRQRVQDGRDRESKLKYELNHGYIRAEHPAYKPPKLTDLQRVCRSLYRGAKKEACSQILTSIYPKNTSNKLCRNSAIVITMF